MEKTHQADLQRIKETEQRILESSERSLALLHESEEIGNATAQEVNRQCEVLKKTTEHLDDLKINLKYCKKQIKGMKSVFNGVKNYFSDKFDHNDRSQITPRHCGGPSKNRVNDKLHVPGRIASEDRCKSYSETCLYDLDVQQVKPAMDSQHANKQLDANLDEIVIQIARLKSLSLALGEGIEYSTKLIDKIQVKVDGADVKVVKINKQVEKQLLK